MYPEVGSLTKTCFCRKLCVQNDKMGTVSSLNRGWFLPIFKNSKATSLVVCQEDIPPKFCIPCHPHQTFQYYQILSHHCNFGQELVGCRKEACVEHVCPFTDLCLTDVQDLKQDLENGEREGFKMAFSSPKWHREFYSFSFLFEGFWSSICPSVDLPLV